MYLKQMTVQIGLVWDVVAVIVATVVLCNNKLHARTAIGLT